MEAQSFAYWLKGYVELNGTTPTEAQWKIIVDHLEKVFDKQTPNRDNGIQQPTQGPNTTPSFRTMELRQSDMPSWTMPTFDWSKIGQPGGGAPVTIC